MGKKYNILLILFGIDALIHLVALILDWQEVIFISKPLLLVFLSLYFYNATKTLQHSFYRFILVGLIFSIGGDTFLMTTHEYAFVAGLGCFLVTQICYSIAFIRFPDFKRGLLAKKLAWILPFALYYTGLMYYMWDNLGDFKIPVLIYSAVLMFMALMALNLKGRIPNTIFRFLFIGVLLFLISDSIIALDKFQSTQLSIPFSRLLIMSTYIVSQYLIATRTSKLIISDAS